MRQEQISEKQIFLLHRKNIYQFKAFSSIREESDRKFMHLLRSAPMAMSERVLESVILI